MPEETHYPIPLGNGRAISIGIISKTVYNTLTGEKIPTISPKTKNITVLKDSQVLGIDKEGNRIYNILTGKTIQQDFMASIFQYFISSEGQLFTTDENLFKDKSLVVFNRKLNKTIKLTSRLDKIIETTNNRIIAKTDYGSLFDLQSGEYITKLPESNMELIPTADGNLLAKGQSEKTVYAVNLFDNKKSIELIRAFEKERNTEYTELMIKQIEKYYK